MTSRHSLYVFLIYSHADKVAVHHLYTRLTKAGVKVWLDTKVLMPGQDWKTEIRRAILKSEAVVVCLSRQFNKPKGYRHQELRIALERAVLFPDELMVIPARLEECEMPRSLHGLQRVDLFEANGFRMLRHALRRLGEGGVR